MKRLRQLLATLAIATLTHLSPAQSTPFIQIDTDKVTGHVSPALYGLMTEEINYSYEGGLYGELVRNRTFKADAREPRFWTPVGGATISLDKDHPLNDALNLSLKLDAPSASDQSPAGVANGGYWGIPVRPNTTYRASLYARGPAGPLTVSIQSADGKTTFATATTPEVSAEWKRYDLTLKTAADAPTSKDNRLLVTSSRPGTLWLQQISLFPPTYHDRTNGTRPDIMKLLADMHPTFLRFPGGNYVEGDYFSERFDWKKTIGDISTRPGHRSCWGYWSTDGMGLLEFLEWCEDLKMQPVLAVFAGYCLKHDYAKPGPDLQPYVDEALEEIEYVTGDPSTKWGAQRAKDGHPAPFKLTYVEIGNEDWFDRSGSYDGRFAQFFDAIKQKYPALQCIATTKVTSRTPNLIDEHYYRSLGEMEAHAFDYDKRPRTDKTKVFVGEWATRVGSPTPNMSGALGDAAWLTGLERNADIVLMSCYAPLFVNVSDIRPRGQPNSSMQWATDLIGYDALTSYGSPSYYVQQMFATHVGDEILATQATDLPTRQWQPPARRNAAPPPPQQVRKFFYSATRDAKSGTIYLKLVNNLDTAQPVKVQLKGDHAIQPQGKALVLQGNTPDDTNTLQEPTRITPREQPVTGLAASFTRELPPYSVTVLELATK